MRRTFCCDKEIIFRSYIAMLKRMIIMQALIFSVGQFVVCTTALGGLINITGAEQQVGAEIACKYKEGNVTVEEKRVPVPPQGPSDADLNVSLAHYGVSVEESLASVFSENQVTANGSAYASAVWGQQPADACDVHGGGGSGFALYFTAGPSPAYLNINGQINIDMYRYPDLHPEETFVYVKLSSDDGSGMITIWRKAASGTGGDTSKAIGHGLWLEADKTYLLEAYAESGTVASKDHTDFKSRTASFSFTATIEPTSKVEITGPHAVTLFYPLKKSPKIVLNAQADTPGGEYEWTIFSGEEKLQFVGNNTHEKVVRVKGKAPSEYLSDVVIKVTYTVNSQSYDAFHEMTVQKPTLLKVAEGYPKEPVYRRNDVGQVISYKVLYAFQVFDQLVPAKPITTDRMVVEEERDLCYRNYNVGRIPRRDRDKTNKDGCFDDELELATPNWWPWPLPKDLFMTVNQRFWVEGWPVHPRCQIYHYDYAISEEGSCTGCQ